MLKMNQRKDLWNEIAETVVDGGKMKLTGMFLELMILGETRLIGLTGRMWVHVRSTIGF